MTGERQARVAVICAMDSEATHLRERLADAREGTVAHWRRTTGTLGAAQVAIVVSHIGLVNAAAATSALLALDPPEYVLNYGCSGAHREDILLGDVVIAREVVHLTSQIILPDGTRKYWGFNYRAGGTRIRVDHIEADPQLLAVAETVSSSLTLEPWPGQESAPTVHVGAVGSADVWTQHGGTIRELHTQHGSLCEEMEAAAIAQVCAIYGVPFLAVKDISNNELHAYTDLLSEGGAVLAHVEEEVGKRAAVVVEGVIASFKPEQRQAAAERG